MSRGHSQPGQRQLRVGEELRRIIVQLLERRNIRDPDVALHSVTVTSVAVSPDLKNAIVFVLPFGGGDVVPLLAGLKRITPYLRREMAKELSLRTVPGLVFRHDDSFEHADRIEALLNLPEVRRDLHQDTEGLADGT